MPPAVALAALLVLQGAVPLKKSDLIRLLSTSLPLAEIAALVQRRCVSFAPSARDKADLRALGATDLLIRRLDECARKIAPLTASARLRAAAVAVGGRAGVLVDVRRGTEPAAGVRVVLRGSGKLLEGPDAELLSDEGGRVVFDFAAGRAPGTYRLVVADPDGKPFDGTAPLDLTIRPAPLVPSAARTGFVSGTAQRGRVATRLPLPLVFEVRDSANRPVPGRAVTLTGVNVRLEHATATTDSAGQVRVAVVLGERAGPAHVAATVGPIERQAPLVVVAGPAAKLVLRCGTADVAALELAPGFEHQLRLHVQDALGNDVSFGNGVRVAPRDTRVVQVVSATGAAGTALVLRAVRAGTTSVVVEAAGLRLTVATTVASGEGNTAPCRRAGPRD
jgi:hypothetical protein